MKKALLAAAALFVALFVTVGIAPSASAYPELTCNVTVDSQVVNEGDQFTATAEAAVVESRVSAEGDDISWVMTFHGATRTGTGAVFQQTFTAPAVDATTKFKLTATADTAAGTCTHSVDITVLPGGTVVEPPSGGLPNTGGPRLAFLIFGVALVLAGGTAVGVARRRA